MSRKSKRRFWGRLKTLGFSTYGDYLASPHWNEVKERFWTKNKNRSCRGCGQPATQIHHKTYKRLGEERLNVDLVGLCRGCHVAVHDAESYLPERWGLFGVTKVTLRRKRKGSYDHIRRREHAKMDPRERERELARLIAEQAEDQRR